MNIVEKLRLMQTDHIPELGEAIAEIEHLRREAQAWSKVCEDATTKLYKLSTHHPRLEVRYWTGKYWEPLYGARFHEVLNALDLTPNADLTHRKLATAEIDEAYDQAADMVVKHGTKVRAG